MRQGGSEGAGPAAGRARTHVAQDAGHGISLVCAPGETGQLPDRTSGEVTGDHGERSVQPGGKVEVAAGDGGRGAERRVVHGQGPGAGQGAGGDAAKRPCADVAAYSSPLIESVDVVAAIAAAGPVNNAAAAAKTGTIHPCQRMTHRTSAGRWAERRGLQRSESRQHGPDRGRQPAGGMPPRAGHRWRVVARRPGRRPGASLPGPAPPVRCWWARRVPAGARDGGPGGMRDRARHLTTARRRPRWRPATGGRKDAIPRVARLPRAPGHRTWAWDGRPSPALSPPFPARAVAPAPAARCAGPAAAGRDLAGG